MTLELQRKLRRIYDKRQEPDVWGKRPATAREIQAHLEESFEDLEAEYLPTEEDIHEKDE